jgi:hypothetical protein
MERQQGIIRYLAPVRGCHCRTNVLPLPKEEIPYGGDREHFLRGVSISWHMLLPWNSASLQPVSSLVRRWGQVTEEGKEEVKPCVI